MSNKFNVLGSVLKVDDSTIDLKVRRNFRNSDHVYDYDTVSLNLSLGVSPTLISTLNIEDIIQVYGRVQSNDQSQIILVVEQITPINELQSELRN